MYTIETIDRQGRVTHRHQSKRLPEGFRSRERWRDFPDGSGQFKEGTADLWLMGTKGPVKVGRGRVHVSRDWYC